MHTTASSKRAWVRTRIRPTSLSVSLCHLPLPAVPSRSPAKLGGRCCCAKLALKCLPGSPVSPTTQSNHIRSLYLCLGQVRRCSCVHPRSTFGVEGPPALNVRPQKKKEKERERKKKLFHSHFLSLCLSSASADNPAVWLRAAALRKRGGGRGRMEAQQGEGEGEGVAWTPGSLCWTDVCNNLLPYTCTSPCNPADAACWKIHDPGGFLSAIKDRCPPSPSPSLPRLPSLRCFSPLSSLFSTPPLPTLPSTPNLPPDSSDSSHFDQVKFICSANYHTRVSLRGRLERANNSSRSYRINMSS